MKIGDKVLVGRQGGIIQDMRYGMVAIEVGGTLKVVEEGEVEPYFKIGEKVRGRVRDYWDRVGHVASLATEAIWIDFPDGVELVPEYLVQRCRVYDLDVGLSAKAKQTEVNHARNQE